MVFSAIAGHAEHKRKPPGMSPVSGEKGGSENAQMCSRVCVCVRVRVCVCVCVRVCVYVCGYCFCNPFPCLFKVNSKFVRLLQ